jgi:hypothetical protein
VFEEHIRLPPAVRGTVARWRKAREKTAEVIAKAHASEAAAARELAAAVSLRDAGELLGMSAEGVRKALEAEPDRTP